MINKKVRNATVIECDGITFRSILEQKTYIELRDAGYAPQYEVEKIGLLDSFRPKTTWYVDGEPQVTKGKKQQNTTVLGKSYTPDFKVTLGDTVVYVEVKGHPNDVYPVTRKMFLKWIDEQDNDIIFSEIHSIKGLKKFMEVLKQVKTENEENQVQPY